MKLKMPVRFEHWALLQDKADIGLQVVIKDELLKTENAMTDIISSVIAKGLVKYYKDNGRRFGTINLNIERDAALRGDVISVVTPTITGDSPVEYASVAYNGWVDEWNKVQDWQSKSLWQYFKYWFNRKFRHKKSPACYAGLG